MKKLNHNSIIFSIAILFLTSILMTGCMAPINTTYESARMLGKGGIEVQGSYSVYAANTLAVSNLFRQAGSTRTVLLNRNIGFRIGYGFSESFSIKLRYERLTNRYDFRLFGEDQNDLKELSYYELQPKFRLKTNKLALALPIGVYYRNGESLFTSFNPRLIYTISRNDKFELNIIPKFSVFIFGNDKDAQLGSFVPGLNFGVGWSKDLNRWAIRPEFGVDLASVSFGIGFSYKIATREWNY